MDVWPTTINRAFSLETMTLCTSPIYDANCGGEVNGVGGSIIVARWSEVSSPYRYLSADPADSPRVYRPTMPPPCFQRPWRSISWVDTPFWAMRWAMPTRPLCPTMCNSCERKRLSRALVYARGLCRLLQEGHYALNGP